MNSFENNFNNFAESNERIPIHVRVKNKGMVESWELVKLSSNKASVRRESSDHPDGFEYKKVNIGDIKKYNDWKAVESWWEIEKNKQYNKSEKINNQDLSNEGKKLETDLDQVEVEDDNDEFKNETNKDVEEKKDEQTDGEARDIKKEIDTEIEGHSLTKKTLIAKLVGSTGYRVLGSVLGVKFIGDLLGYGVGKLSRDKAGWGDIYNYAKQKKAKNEIDKKLNLLSKELEGSWVKRQEWLEKNKGKDYNEELKKINEEFQGKINEFNSILKNDKAEAVDRGVLDEEEKKEFKKKLASIIAERSRESKEKKEEDKSEVAKVTEKYLTTKIKGVRIAKDALNTALTFSGLHTLRGVSYGGSAFLEWAQKTKQRREKDKLIKAEAVEDEATKYYKDKFIQSARETFRAAAGKGKQEGSKHRVKEAIEAYGTILTGLGMGGVALQEYLSDGNLVADSYDKLLNNVEEKGILKAGFDNFYNRGDQILSSIDSFFSGQEDGTEVVDTLTEERSEADLDQVTKISQEDFLQEVQINKEEALQNFVQEHSLLQQESSNLGDKLEINHSFNQENALDNTEVSISIGKEGAYENMDQALRRLVIDTMNKEQLLNDKEFTVMDAAKAENVLANIREMIQGNEHIIDKFPEIDINQVAEWQDGKLLIKDYDQFTEMVNEELFSHANEVVNERSDALAYVDNTSQKVWQELFNKKGAPVEIDNFSDNDLVKQAEQRTFQQQVEAIKKVGNDQAEIISRAGEEESVGQVLLKINGRGYTFEVEDGLITSFNGYEQESPVPINSDLVTNINNNLFEQQQIAEEKYDLYFDATKDLQLISKDHPFLDPNEIFYLKNIDKVTNGFTDRFEIFMENKGLIKFSYEHDDIGIDDLEKLGKFTDQTVLESGLLARNQEALNFSLEHIDEDNFSIREVSNTYGLQKNIEQAINFKTSMENIYELRQNGIEFFNDKLLDGQRGLLVDIPKNENNVGGALFMQPDGSVYLYNSNNILLNNEVNTYSHLPADQVLNSEETLRQTAKQLQEKENFQNRFYAELQEAAKEKGFFKWLAVDMEEEYLRQGLDLPANSLESEDEFKQALLNMGDKMGLKKFGQENNFEKIYTIIEKRLTGADKNFEQAFSNYWQNHQPLPGESMRMYLGRFAGDNFSTKDVMKEIISNKESINELSSVGQSTVEDSVQANQTDSQFENMGSNQESIEKLKNQIDETTSDKDFLDNKKDDYNNEKTLDKLKKEIDQTSVNKSTEINRDELKDLEAEQEPFEKDIEKQTVIRDSDKDVIVNTKKEINVIDDQKIESEQSNIEGMLRGNVTDLAATNGSFLAQQLETGNIENKEDYLQAISNIKEEYTGQSELSKTEIKSAEITYRGFEQNPNSRFLKEKIEMDILNLLAKYNKKSDLDLQEVNEISETDVVRDNDEVTDSELRKGVKEENINKEASDAIDKEKDVIPDNVVEEKRPPKDLETEESIESVSEGPVYNENKIEMTPTSNKDLVIERNEMASQSDLSVFIPHETEIDALQAAKTEGLREIAYLQGDGAREYKIDIDGTNYNIDPNNAFSEPGIKKEFINSYGAKEWQNLGEEKQNQIINECLERSQVVVDNYLDKQSDIVFTLHQNYPGGFGIKSYLPGGHESEFAADVFVNEKMNPDNFAYVNDQELFEAFKKEGVNVILQNNDKGLDDGSVSYWAAKNNKPYVNIEVGHGQHEEQARLVRTFKKILDNYNKEKIVAAK